MLAEVNEIAIVLSAEQYALLLLGSFLATLTGSLIGIGGGFVILGILSILLPIAILVPVLAAVLACIDLSRAVVFRSDVYTPILQPFLAGCIPGVIFGSLLFVSLSETVIGTGLAILILLFLMIPTTKIGWNIRYPFFWVGTIHSFFSTMFGFGGLFQATMLRTKLANLQVTATLATSFLALELMKICAYVASGFNYIPYLGIIVTAACGAIPAALIGRRLSHRVSHNFYRIAQKTIILIITINILIRVWV